MNEEEEQMAMQQLGLGQELDLPIMPSGKPQIADRANVIEQIDPERLITDIKHILQGEDKDDDGKWTLPKGSEPHLNLAGVHRFGAFLRMIINKNLIFTKYKGDDLREVLLDIETDVNDHLRMNAKKYEIKAENYILVVNMIIHPIEAAYKRSIDGFTSDFVGNVTRQLNTNREFSQPMPMPMMMPRESFIKKSLKKVIPFA